MTLRVLLMDDHPVVRAGLRAMLESDSDLEVLGEAECGVRSISLSQTLRPDVVVSDLLLPDGDGVVVTQVIRKNLPDTLVVILNQRMTPTRGCSTLGRGTNARKV